jgi:uncharacterized protein YutE (UPF0331/DUF86 family)
MLVSELGEHVRILQGASSSDAVEKDQWRNILIHHYFGTDLDVVWSVVEDDLPDLRVQVDTILNKQE